MVPPLSVVCGRVMQGARIEKEASERALFFR